MEAVPVFPQLDPVTLLCALCAMGLLTSAMAASSARALPDFRWPLVRWSQAMLGLALSAALYVLRGRAPDALTFALPNVLLLHAVATVHIAYAHVLGRPAAPWWRETTVAVGTAGVAAVWLGGAPHGLAVFTIAAAVSANFGRASWLLLSRRGFRREPALMLSAAGFVAATAVFGSRAVLAASGQGDVMTMHARSLPQVSALLVGALFVFTASLGLFVLIHERQRRMLEDSASRDSLTGLYTRGAFFDRVQVHLRACVSGTPYAVVMLDIDHFKRINDEYGHQAGDVVLAHAARMAQANIRQMDYAGRYGGEEFCLFLKGCRESDAQAFAERIVDLARRQHVSLRDGRSVTYSLSAGYACAEVTVDGPRLEDVLERADRALYAAKHDGRDRAKGAHALQGTVRDERRAAA